MTLIQQKFKALEDELELNPSISKSSKVHLKQVLADERRKVEQIYQTLKGANRDALACPFFNETIQQYLLSSERTFRAQMQRCISDNQHNTQQAIGVLSTALSTPVIGPQIKRPNFQTPPATTVREDVGGVICHYRGLFAQPRDTSGDRTIVDRIVGTAVQDSCALVQTATLLPKIVVVGIVTAGSNASETVRDAVHHAGEVIANLPISRAYVSARNALTERVEQNHGVSEAWTRATVDDVAAMATMRLPRFLSNRPFSRSFSLPPGLEREMAVSVEAAASTAETASSIPSISTLFAKRHHPRSHSCKPSSSEGISGAGNQINQKKIHTTTTQVSEQLAPGYMQVSERRVQTIERYEHGRIIKTTTEDRTTGLQVSKDARPLDIVFTRKAAKDLSKLETKHQAMIHQEIESLKTNPFPPGYIHMRCPPGEHGRFYRTRVGKHRIIYAVENNTGYIHEVGGRPVVYRGF